MKSQAAIDLGHRRLRAVEAIIDRGRATVVRSLDVDLPAGIAEGSAADQGAFVSQSLRAAGFACDRATWTIARDRLVVKRIALPGAEPHELPGMVRLAMTREATVGADAAIDFVPSPGEAWAIAAPSAALDAVRAVASAAGIGVDRIAPRTCGSAHLLASLPRRGTAAAVDLAGDSIELVIAGDDGLRASRGTAVHGTGPDAAVTEARRTWTAFRLQQPDPRPSAIDVIGAPDVAALVVEALSADAGVPVSRLDAHPAVTAAGELGAAWPLVGLLLEPAARRLDLAAPRRAPDLATRRRMRAYAAVAVLALAYCAGWTIGRKERTGIEARRADLRAQADAAVVDHRSFCRADLRARHLDAWTSSQPAWLDSMMFLCGFAPDPSRTVLAGWHGQVLESEAVVGKDGAMRIPGNARITLEAEAVDRSTADALREALVSRRDFTVRSTTTEGKAGRRLPVAFELVIEDAGGPPVERPASASVSRRGGAR